MAPSESRSVSVSPSGGAHGSARGDADGSPCGGAVGREPEGTVVWLRGDHDIATRAQLSVTIAQAARLDDCDVVVDLSGVTFMDASTIGALVVARNRLRAASRALWVRSPSPGAFRILDLCGLARLLDERRPPASPPAARALGSWVDVPAGERDEKPRPSVDHRSTPSPDTARVLAQSSREATASVDAGRSRS